MTAVPAKKNSKGKNVRRRSWRTKKASNTRFRILEAALDCLVEIGFTQTSIATIAAKAGLSRGAVQFHFPTKAAAMVAVTNHILQRRLDMYRADMAKIPPSEDYLDHAIHAYWKQVTRPEFIAQQEIALAARTDPALADSLRKAYREYVTRSREPFLREFPAWNASRTQYETSANLAQYLVEGMAWGYTNRYLNDKAVKEMLQSLRTVVGNLLGEQTNSTPKTPATRPQPAGGRGRRARG